MLNCPMNTPPMRCVSSYGRGILLNTIEAWLDAGSLFLTIFRPVAHTEQVNAAAKLENRMKLCYNRVIKVEENYGGT